MKTSSQELWKAIEVNDVQRVRVLLQSDNNNIDLHAPEHKNLLWLAMSKDELEIIEILIRAGAPLTVEDPEEDYGHTILHELTRKYDDDKQYERLAILAIECGADIHACHDDGQTILNTAISVQATQLIRELHNHGALVKANFENLPDIQVDNTDDSEDMDELEDNDEDLPFIIDTSDSLNAQERNQKVITVLIAQLRASMYNFETFKNILDLVLDVNQFGNDGNTLLVVAARYGRADAVVELLNRGADVNLRNSKGILPLYAASTCDMSPISKLFVTYGASVHDRNSDGKYPIHGACTSRTMENLYFLLTHGATLNVTDNYGQYPIHIACTSFWPEVVHFLLSLGEPIDVTDNNGNTPFSLNNCPSGYPTKLILIKHCALLEVTNGRVKESDLMLIKADEEMASFYQDCRAELEMIREIKVFENFNLLTLMTEDTTTLSSYLKNDEFARAIGKCYRKCRDQLSFYIKQFRMSLKIARQKRNLTRNFMKKVLIPTVIPQLGMSSVNHYELLKELKRVEYNFYLDLYHQITESGQNIIPYVMY